MPRTLANAITGVVVEQVGWTSFFLLCSVVAIPGMLLLFKVAPWNAPFEAFASANESDELEVEPARTNKPPDSE